MNKYLLLAALRYYTSTFFPKDIKLPKEYRASIGSIVKAF